jgi:sulfite exporter TauE/SafE
MATEVLMAAALAAGFFGSGHCLGMCGAVVSLIEQSAQTRGAWRRRVAYNAGRLGFYVLLGALAGGAGFVLTRLTGVNAGLAALRAIAALLVILLALNLLFDLRSLRGVEAAGLFVWRRMAPFATHVLPATTLPRALGAGFLWGALPCGLVYSAVAMAGATGSSAGGAAVMLAFWTGTAPALFAAGSLAARLPAMTRRPLIRRAGGALLLVIGLLALALPFWPRGHGEHARHVLAMPGAVPSDCATFKERRWGMRE